MFDLDLLRYRRFVGVNATAIALAFTLLPLLVLLPTYFSAVEGFSAIHAGGSSVLHRTDASCAAADSSADTVDLPASPAHHRHGRHPGEPSGSRSSTTSDSGRWQDL